MYVCVCVYTYMVSKGIPPLVNAVVAEPEVYIYTYLHAVCVYVHVCVCM